MAPTNKVVKTYEKRNRKSADVLNALLAQNITKRLIGKKKAKIKLKELPPRTSSYLSSDSLKVNTEDTFDKVLKGAVFNQVKVMKKFVKVNSSESDVSHSQVPQVSVSYHSPIMTRKRVRQSGVIITEAEKSSSKSGSLPVEKSSTLDKPVDVSLTVEKENKKLNFSSLSYIQLPKIEENKLMRSELSTYTRMEASYEPIFSDTFRERQTVHSSTPCVAPTAKIVADSISPICAFTPDRKLIKRSYDEIKKWDSNYPSLDKGPTPPGPVLRSATKKEGTKNIRRRKLSTFLTPEQKKKCDDWKLNCQPKVYFKPDDIIDVDKAVKSDDHFRGFSDSEQSASLELLKQINAECSMKKTSKAKEKKVEEIGVRRSKRITAGNAKKSTNTPNKLKSKSESDLPDSKNKKLKTTVKITPGTGKFRKLSTRKTPKSVKRTLRSESTRKTNDRYITLRRKVIRYHDISQSRSVKKNKQSRSSASDSVVTSSSNLSNKPSVVSYSCEDLNRDLEINLPNVNKENEVTSPNSRSFDQKDFESFVDKYYKENKTEDVQNSGRTEDRSTVFTCADFTNVNKSNEKIKSPLRNKSSNRSTRSNPKSLILSRKDSSPKRNLRSTVSRISSLEKVSSPEIFNESLKIYQNIVHDHSYSSPEPMRHLPVSPKARKTKEKREDSSSKLSDIIECSLVESDSGDKDKNLNRPVDDRSTVERKRRKSITLKPGKSYRRSLSLLKRSTLIVNVLNSEKCINDCTCSNCVLKEKLSLARPRRVSVIVPVIKHDQTPRKSILEVYARRNLSYVQDASTKIIDLVDESVRNFSLNSRNSQLLIKEKDERHNAGDEPLVSAKDIVLRRCGQTEIVPFDKCYPTSALQHCQKIGEGVYGEVFLYRNQNGGTSVMKIIPIEGDLIVNGEKQKKYEEIITEIIISMELSNLRNGKINCTSGFTELKAVRCVQGCYPDKLLDLWDLYDENYGSENDSPQIFPPDQLYVVLELANGGQDVESYVFNSALQVFSMFKQTACALAVAESQLKFEHRDLHWGNILVTTVDKNKTLQYRLNGKDIEVQTHGVEVAIIDFTLSRMECDGVVIFNDLSLDNDLFVAKGDYQFEIYRLMQKSNGNNWETFNPYTNILWLHYVLDKAVTLALRYKNTRSKVHKEYLEKLKKLMKSILTFHSAVDFVVNTFV